MTSRRIVQSPNLTKGLLEPDCVGLSSVAVPTLSPSLLAQWKCAWRPWETFVTVLEPAFKGKEIQLPKDHLVSPCHRATRVRGCHSGGGRDVLFDTLSVSLTSFINERPVRLWLPAQRVSTSNSVGYSWPDGKGALSQTSEDMSSHSSLAAAGLDNTCHFGPGLTYLAGLSSQKVLFKSGFSEECSTAGHQKGQSKNQ